MTASLTSVLAGSLQLAVVTAVAYPTTCIATGQPWAVCLYTLVAGAWVIWRHRANIARLRAGTENRINLRAVFAGRTSSWASGRRSRTADRAGAEAP